MVELDPSKFRARVRFSQAAPDIMNETYQIVQEYIQKHTERYMQIEPISELKEMSTYHTATNQSQAESAISAGQYIIGSVDTYGQFSISSTPAIHINIATAKTEAKRLAGNQPGKTFVVMKLTSGYRSGGILEF